MSLRLGVWVNRLERIEKIAPLTENGRIVDRLAVLLNTTFDANERWVPDIQFSGTWLKVRLAVCRYHMVVPTPPKDGGSVPIHACAM